MPYDVIPNYNPKRQDFIIKTKPPTIGCYSRRIKALFFIPAFFTLVITACGPEEELEWPVVKNKIRSRFPDVAQMSTEELAGLMEVENGNKPVLIDVRALEEFEVSRIRGAKRAESERDAIEVLKNIDKDCPIVLYCSVGYRSSQLADKLRRRGYSKVFNLEGAIFQWANEGRPVYSDSGRVYRVHPYDRRWGRLLDEKYRTH